MHYKVNKFSSSDFDELEVCSSCKYVISKIIYSASKARSSIVLTFNFERIVQIY